MTRNVSCNIINYTGNPLTLQQYAPGTGGSGGAFNDYHGTWHTNPVSTIPTGGKSTLAFEIQKTTGGNEGATGWVSYDLGSQQGLMYVMFNNPHDQSSNTYADDNCWAYVVIQGYDGGPAPSFLGVKATLSGITINVTNPVLEDTINITVTVENQ